MSLLTGSAAAGQARDLETRWKAARDGQYLTPGSIELQQATELFRRELASDPSPQLEAAWQALGWQRTTLQLNGTTCHLLHESAERREGRGPAVGLEKRAVDRVGLFRLAGTVDDVGIENHLG